MDEAQTENQSPAAPNLVVVAKAAEPNLVIRALWFIALGWWLSGLAALLAILLQLTVIGIPAAIWVINRIPQITTLKSSRKLQIATDEGGTIVVGHADR